MVNKLSDVKELIEQLNEINEQKRQLELKIYPYVSDDLDHDIDLRCICSNCGSEYSSIYCDIEDIEIENNICGNCEDS